MTDLDLALADLAVTVALIPVVVLLSLAPFAAVGLWRIVRRGLRG